MIAGSSLTALALAAAAGIFAGAAVTRFTMKSRSIQSPRRSNRAAEERARIGAILASMTEGVVAVDSQQTVVHVNAAAERLFDLSAETCVGAPAWKVLRSDEIIEALEHTLESNDEHEIEVRFRTRALHPRRRMELRVAPLREEDGRVGGAVLVFHDVTRLRHLESVRQDFVANVSHEIKTPLASIQGMVETMIDDPSMKASTQSHFLTRILKQTLRLGSLVKDLMALSRFESEDLPLADDELDLRRIILDAAEQFQPAANAKDLDLFTDLPSEAIMVNGDNEALRQVFDNLLSNAIRYTPERGEITVTLRKTGKEAWVEVIDSGIGIEAEHMDRIFERFYRVDKARSRELGGTGLGLSIVKHITARLEGGVSVQSKVGEGSSFRVHLPLADSKEEAPGKA